MKMDPALPKILVFDDVCGWDKNQRKIKCDALGLCDITPVSWSSGDLNDFTQIECQPVSRPEKFLARAVFHPASKRVGNRVEADVEGAIKLLEWGWKREGKYWALVLLDLQFEWGTVQEWPPRVGKGTWFQKPEKGSEYPDVDETFGLKLLKAIAEKFPDAKRPGRTQVPIVAHSRNRNVEKDLNDLGSLGHLPTEGPGRGEPEKERLADRLFHFGLFPDGKPTLLFDDEKKIVTGGRGEPLHGATLPMLMALREARQASASKAPCLLQGPVGAGKGAFARRIHELSSRGEKPFIQRDCASLPETLLEMELFGYDAKSGIENANPKGKQGDFERADAGSLFLDEIGEMTGLNQAKLLITLGDEKVTRLGGLKPIPIDVRVLAATNLDLEEAVHNSENKRFNKALYSRLCSLVIHVPSLAERREDIPELFKMFVNKETQKIGGELSQPDDSKIYPEDTLALLTSESRIWEFNVRQLKNLARRIAVERKFSMVIAPNDVKEPQSNVPRDSRVADCRRRVDAFVENELEESG